MGEGCTCFEPENIMCSKRCANPLCPGVWFAAPTWYQTSTATCGRRWSSLRITVSPFGSWYFSNLISGSAARADSGTQSAKTAAMLRMCETSSGRLLRAPRCGKPRVRVLRIVRHLFAEPGGAVEPLLLLAQLDLRQPEIVLAEMVELESADPAPDFPQRPPAQPEQRLGVVVRDGVVELRPREQAFALDGELRVPDPLVRGDQPHADDGLHAQIALLELVALRQWLWKMLPLHQELPLDLDGHRNPFTQAGTAAMPGRPRFPPG